MMAVEKFGPSTPTVSVHKTLKPDPFHVKLLQFSTQADRTATAFPRATYNLYARYGTLTFTKRSKRFT